MDWPVVIPLNENTTLALRPLKRRDVWKAAAALARIAEEEERSVGAEAVNIGRTADQYLLSLSEKRHLYLVALLDGEFAGLTSARPGQFGEKDRHVATLSLWLLPWARGRGVGTHMTQTMLVWCREAGYEKVELEVFSTNTPALRLYRRFGFVVEVRQRRAIKFAEGEYVDNLIMGTFLV